MEYLRVSHKLLHPGRNLDKILLQNFTLFKTKLQVFGLFVSDSVGFIAPSCNGVTVVSYLGEGSLFVNRFLVLNETF